ncbi:uncharacterized protein B0I36DRAFT_59344 [Microdochium trichocladiopsis]|uniref:Uncharacterized protein n=1 Tax=Microdochium trichocladiopsis TaxID=1682393 RepID=A0A9P8XPL3_9PEZI|nr:uncharacterized protein B0I36DRAFT_59344 [Microdochium trichocladiopsis]KAH7009398.1 hypothetical protein B0I36DRAFT_59344 [Microdochium trichocladiopsis]
MFMYLLVLLPALQQLLASLALRLRHNISMARPNGKIHVTVEVTETESLGCTDTSETDFFQTFTVITASHDEADTSRLNMAPIRSVTTCATHIPEPQEKCTQHGSKCALLEHDMTREELCELTGDKRWMQPEWDDEMSLPPGYIAMRLKPMGWGGMICQAILGAVRWCLCIE